MLNDNDVKASVISYINQFFTLDNWEFGETFYFSELSAYVLKEAAPNIVSFLIIPVQSDQSFGSLHEIGCEDNEIFISDATVDNLDIIDSVTADKIKAAGNIVTNAVYQNYGITSASY